MPKSRSIRRFTFGGKVPVPLLFVHLKQWLYVLNLAARAVGLLDVAACSMTWLHPSLHCLQSSHVACGAWPQHQSSVSAVGSVRHWFIPQDGAPCRNPVNVNACPFCDYHVQSEYSKIRSKRTEFKDSRLHLAFQHADGSRLGDLP